MGHVDPYICLPSYQQPVSICQTRSSWLVFSGQRNMKLRISCPSVTANDLISFLWEEDRRRLSAHYGQLASNVSPPPLPPNFSLISSISAITEYQQFPMLKVASSWFDHSSTLAINFHQQNSRILHPTHTTILWRKFCDVILWRKIKPYLS